METKGQQMTTNADAIAKAAANLKALAEQNNHGPEPVTTRLAEAAKALADIATRLDRLELITTE